MMNPILLCLVFVAVTAAAAPKSEWDSFKLKHGKSYDHPLEEMRRQAIFHLNKEKVDNFNKHHAEKAGYKQELNHLSDKTEDELKVLRGTRVPEGLKNSRKAQSFLNNLLSSNDVVANAVDWRDVAGRVSEVKNQGQCGSCWAFSATGALEGQMAVRNSSKGLISLSEQDLVDCSESNAGCDGGIMIGAWTDIASNGGIEDEEDYPYEAKQKNCRFNKKKIVFNDEGGAMLKEADEALLMKTVATFGPVSVAIDASLDSFQLYKEGVYHDKKCKNGRDNLDHGVLVVGYGSQNGSDYWIVKNSWSEAWGEKGYIKMARNKNNHCGIATAAMIPTF